MASLFLRRAVLNAERVLNSSPQPPSTTILRPVFGYYKTSQFTSHTENNNNTTHSNNSLHIDLSNEESKRSLFNRSSTSKKMTEASSSNNQHSRKRARKSEKKSEDKKSVTNLRRSSRLMQSANPITKKMAEPSNNQQPSKRAKKTENKPEEKPQVNRRIVGRLGVYVNINADKLAPEFAHVVNGCATLAMQDYALQNSQNWRDWRLLKIVKLARVMVSGWRYYITFEAENGHGVHHTFQADVWDNVKFGRRTNGFRSLKPRSKWFSGNLWIPLTRSTFYTDPSSPVAGGARYPCPQNNVLFPRKIMGEDCRNTYNEKRAKKSDKILAQWIKPVNLELDKLNDKDADILKDCATLAMHDHLIQTLNFAWRDWELIKIVTAYRRDSVSGSIYNLNFQIGCDDRVRTLEAEVFDGKDQRRVINLRVIQPSITECYPGNLCIPI